MSAVIKRIGVWFLLVSLLFSIAGCHKKVEREAFDLPQTFDESKTYEISFWAKNDTNATQVDIYKKAIADFEALYPNIKVNLKLYNDYGKIYQDVITNIATDTTPNVCITYPDHIATYLTGENSVVPLDELFADPLYGLGGSEVKFDGPTKEEIVPKFLEECKIGYQTYAIPYMRSTEACYVNETYVKALGYELPEVLTWDFIWEVSAAATAKNEDGTYKVNGQTVMIPVIYKSTDNMMITYLAQSNAPYTKADGTVELFNDVTGDFLKTIQENTANGGFSTFKISGYPANFLNAGQCIFAIDSTGGATWMGADAPLIDIPEDKRVAFETRVMMVPQVDIENPKMISQGPSICVFNKQDPQEVLASWLFAQFMLTDDVQIAYSQTEGYLPVTTKAQQNPVYQDYLSRKGEDNDLYYSVKLDAVQLLLDNIDNTFVTPVFNGSASVRDAAGQLIETVTKDTRRNKPLNLEKVYEDTASLKRLDQIQIVPIEPPAQEDSEEPQTATPVQTGLKPLDDKLPVFSKILLLSIAGIWVAMGVWFAWTKLKKHLERKQKKD